LSTPAPGALQGIVFADRNRNGVQEPFEPGLPGVAVSLQTLAGEAIGSTATGPQGLYAFAGLAAGDYRVVESNPAGYYSINPDERSASVQAGEVSIVDFADAPYHMTYLPWLTGGAGRGQ
jgi:hypothetical protein